MVDEHIDYIFRASSERDAIIKEAKKLAVSDSAIRGNKHTWFNYKNEDTGTHTLKYIKNRPKGMLADDAFFQILEKKGNEIQAIVRNQKRAINLGFTREQVYAQCLNKANYRKLIKPLTEKNAQALTKALLHTKKEQPTIPEPATQKISSYLTAKDIKRLYRVSPKIKEAGDRHWDGVKKKAQSISHR